MKTTSFVVKIFSLILVVAIILPAAPASVAAWAAAMPDAPPRAAPPPATWAGSLLPSLFLAPLLTPTHPLTPSLEVDYRYLGLSFEAEPSYAYVGDPITLTLTLRNDGSVPLEGGFVSVTVPAGLAGVHLEGVGDYCPNSNLYSAVLPVLEVGQEVTATLTARVTGPALLAGHVVVWAEGTALDVFAPSREGALIVVGNPGFEVVGRLDFPVQAGGRLEAADGRAAVDFPPGVLNAPGLLRAEHRPWGLLRQERLPEDLPREWTAYYRVLAPFSLDAFDEAGNAVSQFDRPVTITVPYDPDVVAALGMEEIDLALFWWDEDYVMTSSSGVTTTGLWVPLPSRVDTVNHVVTAKTDHFTDHGLSDGSSPSDAFMPGVQSFQVSLYTGAATAGYPIQVPAGPGGMTPKLSLSYSSSAYDGKAGIRDKQQAGWVGRGWSLGMDYIAVVKNPTTGDRNDNGYSMVLNGVSSDLVKGEPRVDNPDPYDPSDYYWHTSDEQFWRIWREDVGTGTHWYDNGSGWMYRQDTVWYIKTRDGTLYQFGSTTPGNFGNRAWWGFSRNGESADPGCGMYMEPYRWLLTKGTDVYSNTVEYTYDSAGQYYSGDGGCGSSVGGDLVVDVWPTQITWGSAGNLRYRVVLASSQRTDDTQFDGAEAQLYQPPHETRRLDSIQVKSKRSTTWELVRRYDLTYDYSLRPDDGHNYPKLTLKSVQMKGTDSNTSLPATSFTYQMSGANYPYDTNGKYRLSSVDNGYGGVVGYTYEVIPTSSVLYQHRNRVTSRTVQDGLGSSSTWSYAYAEPQENYQNNTASIWYIVNVLGLNKSKLVHPEWSEFRGHRKVVVVDPAGNKTVHWFYQGDGYQEGGSNCTPATCYELTKDREALKGREWKTISCGSSTSTVYKKAYSTFTVEHLSHSTNEAFGLQRDFAYLSESKTYDYEGNSSYYKKSIRYYYNPADQGGTQYGNLTKIEEYGNSDNLIRTTYRYYNPNDTADWIIGLVEQEYVFAGAHNPYDLSNWVSATYYVYEDENGSDNPFVPPETTNLARTMQVKDLDVNDTWVATTVDVAMEYDDYGNLTSETVYSSYGSCQPYDGGQYNPASTDPRTTEITFDSTYHIYPVEVEYPNGRSETATYNLHKGVKTSYTDMNNHTVQYRYDALSRRTKVWHEPEDDSDLPTVEFYYVELGTPGRQRILTFSLEKSGLDNYIMEERYFDGLGQTVQVHQDDLDGQEVRSSTLYDAFGHVEYEWVPYYGEQGEVGPYDGYGYVPPPLDDPNNYPYTSYSYDPLGRVYNVTHPDGSIVKTRYDDWRAASINETGHMVIRNYNALGNMTKVREYTGIYSEPNWSATAYATTNYAYNTRDQLSQVTDAAGNVTHIYYDKLGQKTTMDDPDMGVWTYAYDPLGNLSGQTDARGTTINLEYDEMGRLTLKDLPGGSTCDVHYYYDNDKGGGDADAANSWGRLRKTWVGPSESQNNHAFKYDDRGRIIWERVSLDGTGYLTEYTYDTMGRLETMTYPDDEVVVYGYGPHGLLTDMVGSNVYVDDISYEAWRALDRLELGNSGGSPVLQVDYTYYPWNGSNGEGRGRLQRIKAGKPSTPNSLQDLRYDYDLVGNVDHIKDYKAGGLQTQTFTYDALDRLTSARASGGSGGLYGLDSYAYSGNDGKIGNLTSNAGTGYTYGAQSASCPDGALSKPHAVVVAGADSFCYDPNGNQVRRTVGGSTYELSYDAENRLVGVSGAASASFVYGPEGGRVEGTVGGATTLYVGPHYEVGGSTIRKYYDAGGRRVAMRRNGTLYWLLSDHLGSTSVTAYRLGGKKAEVRYTAWGEDRYTYGSTPTTYRYTGQRQEADIGLYYYNARWYDPALGRFVQADTIVPEPGDPQSFNRYSYVRNNPFRFTDPTGHYEFEESPDDPYWIPATPGIMPARRSTVPKAYSSDERRDLIYTYGTELRDRTDIDALEKFARLVEYASSLYDFSDISFGDRALAFLVGGGTCKEVSAFIGDMDCIILGACEIGDDYNRVLGIHNHGQGDTVLGREVFRGQGSWKDKYYDGTNSQMFHFWYYLAVSYFWGPTMASAANACHESPGEFGICGGGGQSREDWLLGEAGGAVGSRLSHLNWLPTCLPQFIRSGLGE